MTTEVVISGIAGKFPESENLEEFWRNLIDGVDMVTVDTRRWNFDAYDMPSRTGKIKNINKFDAHCFGIPEKHANNMDPRLRYPRAGVLSPNFHNFATITAINVGLSPSHLEIKKLLDCTENVVNTFASSRITIELTQEAMFDAGINPIFLRGTKTGVYAGVGTDEAIPIWFRSKEKLNGYVGMCSGNAMLANRTSFVFDFKGPSYSLDSACTSSMVALEHAYSAMNNRICDQAIVVGSQITLDPHLSFEFYKLHMLSPEGKCRAFDANASGYVRSEAVVVFYLCKERDAKRSYATIVHAKSNSDGFKKQGITYPSMESQEELVRTVYEECGVNPLQVEYVEAHGTGTQAGDAAELTSIANVFCKGRERYLLVGASKSNMGHSEPSSGLCGISKVLLAHCHSVLPPNLHFTDPNSAIPALLDGRVKIVTTPIPFNALYASVNSFGYGGTNAHVLLKLTPKANISSWKPDIPVLVPVSGRTVEAVQYFIEKFIDYGSHRSAVALVHEIFKASVSRFPFRGFVLLSPEGSEVHVNKSANEYAYEPSLWFIFSGFGSQWTGMSRHLMRLGVFREAIMNSASALNQYNIDLLEILNSGDTRILEDFKNVFMSITAIQTALVDVLTSVGVTPDGIVGHSHGEIAADYSDGCLTQEQTVLVAMGKAKALAESSLPEGTVAAVGLTWDEAHRRCPADIFPVIHNSQENVTVAGPPEAVRNFLKTLQAEGVLAKEVRSAPYAFHSPYIKGSEKLLRAELSKIITNPMPRSSKWFCSSLPNRDSELAKLASTDYHVHNVLSPVYFYDALLNIPDYAITLEIAPHCFMQSILKQALPNVTANIGLMSKFAEDNVTFFLNSLGKLYSHGSSVQVGKLYEPVVFPVGPETPVISSWIKFDHSKSWDVPSVHNELSNEAGIRFTVDLLDNSDLFYDGHTINGRIIFPASGYIVLVWKAFAKLKNVLYEMLPVVIENIQFVRLTFLNAKSPTEFVVSILSNKGDFEITENSEVVAHGRVRSVQESHLEMVSFEPPNKQESNSLSLNKEEYYKAMRLKGYGWTGVFQGIHNISVLGNCAVLEWYDNWISFLDTMFQTSAFTAQRPYTRGLYIPTKIKKVIIDPQMFKRQVDSTQDHLVPVNVCKSLNVLHCVGVEVRGFKAGLASRRLENAIPTLTQQTFLSFFEPENQISLEHLLDFCIGIVIDNTEGKAFNFTEYFTKPDWKSAADSVSSHCVLRFGSPNCHTVLAKTTMSLNHLETGSMENLEPCQLLYSDTTDMSFADFITPKGFLLLKCTSSSSVEGFTKVALKQTLRSTLTLYRKCFESAGLLIQVRVESTGFHWVETLKTALGSNPENRIIVLISKSTTGLNGLVKCLRGEEGGENIRSIFVDTINDSELNLEGKMLSSQLKYDLVFNVNMNGIWGCYGNLVIPNKELESLQETTDAYANISTIGDLSSLCWVESPIELSHLGSMDCKVEYGSLNFRDVMLATGMLSRDILPDLPAFEDCIIGTEFSGVWNDKRVMGIGASKCLATRVAVNPVFTWEIPKSWSLAEAATVPIVYATAIYGLVIKGQLCPGESVLIHGGAGGVGQAAIHIALYMGCQVYTTVGTNEKREFLKTRFPQLQDENITDSRSALTFESHIKRNTQGKGVDVVLNSLAHDKFHASIECLASFGRFIEIGKLDLYEDTKRVCPFSLRALVLLD